MIDQIINSKLFLLTLTVGVYYGAYYLYKKVKTPLLNPLLVSMVVIILLLKLLNIDYSAYYNANSIINFMLGLSVVALAYPLECNVEHLKGNVLSILISTFTGSLIAILSVWGIAWLMGADQVIIASLQPKSVTTPIALSIAEHMGGIPALTSLGVIFAGLIGVILGPWLFRAFGINNSIARGLAMGAASHALGTAKALEMGALEGAIGGVAVSLMGLTTALLIPIIDKIVYYVW